MSPTIPLVLTLSLLLVPGMTASDEMIDPFALVRETLKYWRRIYKMYREEVILGYCWADHFLGVGDGISNMPITRGVRDHLHSKIANNVEPAAKRFSFHDAEEHARSKRAYDVVRTVGERRSTTATNSSVLNKDTWILGTWREEREQLSFHDTEKRERSQRSYDAFRTSEVSASNIPPNSKLPDKKLRIAGISGKGKKPANTRKFPSKVVGEDTLSKNSYGIFHTTETPISNSEFTAEKSSLSGSYSKIADTLTMAERDKADLGDTRGDSKLMGGRKDRLPRSSYRETTREFSRARNDPSASSSSSASFSLSSSKVSTGKRRRGYGLRLSRRRDSRIVGTLSVPKFGGNGPEEDWRKVRGKSMDLEADTRRKLFYPRTSDGTSAVVGSFARRMFSLKLSRRGQQKSLGPRRFLSRGIEPLNGARFKGNPATTNFGDNKVRKSMRDEGKLASWDRRSRGTRYRRNAPETNPEDNSSLEYNENGNASKERDTKGSSTSRTRGEGTTIAVPNNYNSTFANETFGVLSMLNYTYWERSIERNRRQKLKNLETFDRSKGHPNLVDMQDEPNWMSKDNFERSFRLTRDVTRYPYVSSREGTSTSRTRDEGTTVKEANNYNSTFFHRPFRILSISNYTYWERSIERNRRRKLKNVRMFDRLKGHPNLVGMEDGRNWVSMNNSKRSSRSTRDATWYPNVSHREGSSSSSKKSTVREPMKKNEAIRPWGAPSLPRDRYRRFMEDYESSKSGPRRNSRSGRSSRSKDQGRRSSNIINEGGELARTLATFHRFRSAFMGILRTLGLFVNVGRQIVDYVESNAALACTKDYLWVKIEEWIDG